MLLVPLVLFTSGPFRIVLGVMFLIFFPGYALLAVLFPKKDSLQYLERVVLSLVLSFAIVSLVALMLNYTPWGIRLVPILIAITIFNVAGSISALFRRRRLPWNERFEIRPSIRVQQRIENFVTVLLNFPSSISTLIKQRRLPKFEMRHWLRIPQWNRGTFNRLLSIILLLSILGTTITLVYVVASPKAEESFTDFYILGSGGMAQDYPEELVLGTPVEVTLGIVNHEHQSANYSIEVRIDGEKVQEIASISLADEEKWQKAVALVPTKVGNTQKVEFLLYNGEETKPYLSLHLWVDVIEVK